jgi:hypothetical protein
MEMWKGIKAAERSDDGGFKNITCICSFCSKPTIALAFGHYYSCGYNNLGIMICKTCCNEAIKAIDERILK